jgi:hypothetical protein
MMQIFAVNGDTDHALLVRRDVDLGSWEEPRIGNLVINGHYEMETIDEFTMAIMGSDSTADYVMDVPSKSVLVEALVDRYRISRSEAISDLRSSIGIIDACEIVRTRQPRFLL